MMKKTINNFLSFIFPEYCFICKKEKYILCDECISSFSLSFDTPYNWIQSKYSYKDNRIKKIIHSIKYFHRKDIIYPICFSMKEFFYDKKDHILIPVPMHPIRKYIRGYNHAEKIATCFSQITNLNYNKNIIKRNSYKKQQVLTKNKKERLNNLKNNFKVCIDVKNKSYILIDDVTTTGATLKEIRDTLIKKGAKSVSAITIAH